MGASSHSNDTRIAGGAWLACALAMAGCASAAPATDLFGPDTPLHLGAASVLPYPGEATALAFSPDGRTLAAGGHRSLGVHLFDLETGREREVLAGQARVRALAFPPDRSDRLAVCSESTGIYELGGGGAMYRELEPRRPHPYTVNALGHILPGPWTTECAMAWSRDGRHLMVAHRDRVSVWDMARQDPVATWRRRDFDAGKALPKGESLPRIFAATGDGDGLVAITADLRVAFDGATLVEQPAILEGVSLHAVSADGTRVIASRRTREARLELVAISDPASYVVLEPPGAWVDGRFNALLSPDGLTGLVSFRVSFGYRPRLVDTADGRSLGDLFTVATPAAAWSLDGARLAIADDRHIHVVDRSGAAAIGPRDAVSADGAVRALALDDDGQRVATLSRGALRVWGRDGTARVVLRPGPARTIVPAPGRSDGFYAMALDLDRGLGVVAEATVLEAIHVDYTLHFINTDTGARHARASFGRFLGVELAIDGERVVVSGSEGARVYDLASGALVAASDTRLGQFPVARRDALGRSQVIGRSPAGAWVLRAIGGDGDGDDAVEPIHQIGGLMNISSDGATLVARTYGTPGYLALRRRDDPRWSFIRHHGAGPWTSAVSRDGARAAVLSDAGIDVFDVASGELLGRRGSAFPVEVTALALSRDGGLLAAGRSDGTSTLWDLSDLPRDVPLTGLGEADLGPHERELFRDGTALTWSVSRVTPEAPDGDETQAVRCHVGTTGRYAGRLVSQLVCEHRPSLAGYLRAWLVADAHGPWFSRALGDEPQHVPRGRFAPRSLDPSAQPPTLAGSHYREEVVTLPGDLTCLEHRAGGTLLRRHCFGRGGLTTIEIALQGGGLVRAERVRAP